MKSEIKIHPSVRIQNNAIVGELPRGKKKEDCFLEIGEGSTIRSFSVIYLDNKIGKNFNTGHFALIREDNVIGDYSSVGTTAELAPGNRIGDNVRIHSGCFLELCTIGDNVFIGPHTVFLDDPHPPCPKYKDCVKGARVGNNVRIGGNCTILPGVSIGDNCLIGAGSVVSKDIPANSVAYGVPARVVKKMSELECKKGFYKVPYEWINACKKE